jgi:large subunit ribosomal protein L23
MAIIDIFKKKEIKPERKTEKEIIKKVELEKPSGIGVPKKEVKISEAYRILEAPHITEKATALAGKNQYVFKVWSKANKTEIKKAIEDLYGVEVLDVKTINLPAKRRRLGRIEGWRKGYKKAIVRIKEGQKIEILPR